MVQRQALEDLNRALEDLNWALGDLNRALGDLNWALEDLHRHIRRQRQGSEIQRHIHQDFEARHQQIQGQGPEIRHWALRAPHLHIHQDPGVLSPQAPHQGIHIHNWGQEHYQIYHQSPWPRTRNLSPIQIQNPSSILIPNLNSNLNLNLSPIQSWIRIRD